MEEDQQTGRKTKRGNDTVAPATTEAKMAASDANSTMAALTRKNHANANLPINPTLLSSSQFTTFAPPVVAARLLSPPIPPGLPGPFPGRIVPSEYPPAPTVSYTIAEAPSSASIPQSTQPIQLDNPLSLLLSAIPTADTQPLRPLTADSSKCTLKSYPSPAPSSFEGLRAVAVRSPSMNISALLSSAEPEPEPLTPKSL